MNPKTVFVASCLSFLSGFVCCDKTPKLNTVPAGGTVNRNGQPLTGAQVSFYPVDTGSGKGAVGETDSTGRFTLKTLVGGSSFSDGALAGDYTVSVTKLKTAMGAASNDVTQLSKEEQDRRMAEMNKSRNQTDPADLTKPAARESELPTKYADPKTSGLTAKVKAGDKNDFSFELTE